MPTLRAVLVAINDYPTAPLKGCVNDMHSFRDYVAGFCQRNDIDFQPKVLEDSDATRENILQAFDQFKGTTDEDFCLFFYAGHGSHYPVPPEFKHLEPDGELETIVCYDSRREGGRDLTSKELSYRLYEVCKDHKNAVITVMDCCHSGAFRSDAKSADEEVATREMNELDRDIPIDQLYGVKKYRKTESGRISPPLVRRVHLGAARDLETAKEVRIGGRRRGVFTYSLIDALNQAEGVMPYDELISRVNNVIRKAVNDQCAQLLLTRIEDGRLFFLKSTPAPNEPTFLVSHDTKSGWVVNAGDIFGIPRGDDKQKSKFRLLDDDHIIEVTHVQPHQSKVNGMDTYNKSKTYSAVIEQLAQPRFQLAFGDKIDANAQSLLTQALQDKPSDLFRMTEDKTVADFLLNTQEGTYVLNRTGEEKTVGRPVPGINETSAAAFLNELEMVLKWYQVHLLHNPATTIRPEELSITLNRVVDPGNYDNDTKVEMEDWSTPTLFDYQQKNGEWHQPAFQIKIKNNGHRSLWVSLLYLADNYAITNQLMPMQALEPGHEAWALDIDQAGNTYITILLKLDDFYLRTGKSTIEENLKLVVSTDQFDTTKFNQAGIDLNRSPLDGATRSFSSRSQVKESDWRCFDIPLLIRWEK